MLSILDIPIQHICQRWQPKKRSERKFYCLQKNEISRENNTPTIGLVSCTVESINS